jgi:hypothetical protein
MLELAWNHNPPDIHLGITGMSHHTLLGFLFLRWGLATLPRLGSDFWAGTTGVHHYTFLRKGFENHKSSISKFFLTYVKKQLFSTFG